jgi:hypothetical protein
MNKDLNGFGKSKYLMSSFSYVYDTYSSLIKEKKIFLIYKEIQKGAVAKSYMSNGLLIYD